MDENNDNIGRSVEVEGLSWTRETRLIAVLVKRLGGEVSIQGDELGNVRSLVIDRDNSTGITLARSA